MTHRPSVLLRIASLLILMFGMMALAILGHSVAIAQAPEYWHNQGFTKTATVECGKIRYKIYFKREISASQPSTIVISDIWPVGTLPGVIVSSTGSVVKSGSTTGPTPVSATISTNASGWTATYVSAVPTSGTSIAYGTYEIEIEAPIDPTKFVGGQLVVTNQATAQRQGVNFTYTSNDGPLIDNPSVQGNPTKVTISEADYKKCTEQSNGGGTGTPVNSCFSPDIKIVCGQNAGTFDVVLTAQSSNGVMPASVTITPTNAGVTIVNPQASYPVVAGQVKLTVAGANPGDVLTFDVNGTTAGGGSVAGTDLCCTGTLSITIPKDINCNIKPELEVTKSCLPAKPNDNGGFTAICQIKVKSTGAFTTPVSISETLVGNGTVNYLNATDPWACAPPTVPGNTPMNCTLPANTLNPTTDTSIINVSVDFKNAGDVKEAKNCVKRVLASSQGSPGRKHCVPFVVEEKSTVDVSKVCSPATYRKYPVSPVATGIGWVADCKITVTTTGPQSGTLSVSDTLTGGGTIINANAPAPWACSVAGSTAGCSTNGTSLNQTSSTTVIDASVVFPSAGHASEGLNCAAVKVNGQAKDRDCVPIKVENGTLTVVKEAYVNGTRFTSQTFDTKVTCGGNVVATSIQDGAAPYVQSNIPIGTSCTVVEGNGIATPAGYCKEGSTAAWNVTYSPVSPVVIAAGNTTVVVKNELVCNPPPPNGDITITKVCEPVQEITGAINSYQAICHINVTTTGNIAGPITVSENFTPLATGNAGSVSYTGSSTGDAWACSPTSVPSGTPMNCNLPANSLNPVGDTSTIDVLVKFKDKGWAMESENCASVAVAGVEKGKSCTPFNTDIKTPDNFTLDVKKACDQVTELQSGGPWAVSCAVTVIANGGPLPPYIFIGEALQDTNTTRTPPVTLTAFQSADPWVCAALGSGIPANTPLPCGIAGSSFPSSGTSVINFQMYVPKGTKPGEAKNCVSAHAYQSATAPTNPPVDAGPVCVNLPGKDDDKLGKLNVLKEAFGLNGQRLPGIIFPANVTCGSTVTPINVAEDSPYSQSNIPVGTTCSVVETTTAPAADLCPPGSVGSWTASYNPSAPVNITTAGATITIVNRLNCEKTKDVDSKLYVKKVVVNNTPSSVAGLTFEVDDQCNSAQPVGYHLFSEGQNIHFKNYEAGVSCTITERPIAPTTLCGKGRKDVWTTTYAPSQTVVLQPNGTQVTITNTVNCEDVIDTKLTTFTVRKEATYNGEEITNTNFPINVNCTNGVTQSYTLTGGQGATIQDLPNGTTCNVSEGKIGTTGLCPAGTTESWSTTYNPASASNTTSTLKSVLVTVRNQLNCKPIIIKNPLNCDPKTTVLKGDVCVCKFRDAEKVSSTRCEVKVKPVECERGYRRTAENKCALIKLDCGRNEVQKGTRCVFVQPDCPDGTVWNGRRCVEKQKTCRAPLQLNRKTNECFMPRPDCGPGEKYNAKRNRCDKVIVQCKRGFKRQGSECVPIKVIERNCPPGFTKFGKTCVPKIRINCPRGTFATPLGCVRIGGGRKRDTDVGVPRDNGPIGTPGRIGTPGL